MAGWGEPKGPTPEGAQLAEVLDAFDRLWHRCRLHADADELTARLPSPHELRTGETPAMFSEQMDRLRRGEHLHEQGGGFNDMSHLPRTCNGKVRYRSHQEAVRALHTLSSRSTRDRIPTRSYECPRCKGWHLTSQTQGRG